MPDDDIQRLIVAIDALCADIRAGVDREDWDAAGESIARRHELLEQLYAHVPVTTDELAAMRALGARVMDCDRELSAVASAARAMTETELRALHTGRRAAAAYADHTG